MEMGNKIRTEMETETKTEPKTDSCSVALSPGGICLHYSRITIDARSKFVGRISDLQKLFPLGLETEHQSLCTVPRAVR